MPEHDYADLFDPRLPELPTPPKTLRPKAPERRLILHIFDKNNDRALCKQVSNFYGRPRLTDPTQATCKKCLKHQQKRLNGVGNEP